MTRLLCTTLAVTLVLFASGCTSVGPGTLDSDRFDYNEAISQSWKKQMLTNLLRLRYGEPPVFLEVSSVISQYSLEGEVSVGGGLNAVEGQNSSLSLGGVGRWADTPTITYTPMSGQDFTRELLTPFYPESIFALVQAGWPPDLVLGLTLRSLNGIRVREPGSMAFSNSFQEVMDSLLALDEAGAVGLRREIEADNVTTYLYFRGEMTEPKVLAAMASMRTHLGLSSAIREYKLVHGRVPDSEDEIAVLSLSVLEILRTFAALFNVPAIHLEERRTYPAPALQSAGDTGRAPVDVRFSKERPEDAFVAVRNRDYWFYIDDGDFESKTTFSMLMVLTSLAESGSTNAGPIVTIGAGGR